MKSVKNNISYFFSCLSIHPPTHPSIFCLTAFPRTSAVQLLSRVWLFVTPWTRAHQAFLSFTISQCLLKLQASNTVLNRTNTSSYYFVFSLRRDIKYKFTINIWFTIKHNDCGRFYIETLIKLKKLFLYFASSFCKKKFHRNRCWILWNALYSATEIWL